MNRKTFLTAAPFAGALALNQTGNAVSDENVNTRDYYELRLYHFETGEQRLGIRIITTIHHQAVIGENTFLHGLPGFFQ